MLKQASQDGEGETGASLTRQVDERQSECLNAGATETALPGKLLYFFFCGRPASNATARGAQHCGVNIEVVLTGKD
jgi:hypothetical protein